MSEYSDAEIKLINYFEINKDFYKHIAPPDVYNEMAIRAVSEGFSGPAVEAVGRALKAFRSGIGPFRLTKEFDDLIEFDEFKRPQALKINRKVVISYLADLEVSGIKDVEDKCIDLLTGELYTELSKEVPEMSETLNERISNEFGC